MKNKIFINVVLVLVFILGVQTVYSGDTVRRGTAAGMQTTVPVGARYLAMAGANIATVEGVDGIFWNPAGLASLTNSATVVFSTMQIFNSVDVNYIALGFNMGDLGTLGITLKTFDFGDIPLTTVDDVDASGGQTFSPSFSTIGITYSMQLTDVIQVGLTGKLINEGLDNANASAFAVDAGIQYKDLAGFSGLSFGLVIRNIGTSMQYSGPGLTVEGAETGAEFLDFVNREASIDELPASFELGFGYTMDIDDENSLLFASTFNNYNFGSDAFRFGSEYIFDNMIAIRVGYLYETDLDSKDQLYTFTAGAGFNYNIGGTDLSIDYSFRDSQYFDGNNLFSLKLGF